GHGNSLTGREGFDELLRLETLKMVAWGIRRRALSIYWTRLVGCAPYIRRFLRSFFSVFNVLSIV
ncbi:MAG TPA: hypothetical protein PKY22_07285, partial [Accumulibacter sp.]|nr:hypothetical protein [Accumulibacter sp.]